MSVPTIYVFSKNIKIVKQFQLKFVIFTALKNRRILHGPVFVMHNVGLSLFAHYPKDNVRVIVFMPKGSII